MRYPITISHPLRGLFRLFGFAPADSYVELDGQSLRIRYGTADERIPLTEIAGVERRRWPWFYGLGAKYGPNDGVAYVGSRAGVVRIDFLRPRPMNVWGPLSHSHARCVIVSVENADEFIEAVKSRTGRG